MQSKKKPAKPHPHFPLFTHASGKWAKKISGKIEYDLPPKNCIRLSERIGVANNPATVKRVIY